MKNTKKFCINTIAAIMIAIAVIIAMIFKFAENNSIDAPKPQTAVVLIEYNKLRTTANTTAETDDEQVPELTYDEELAIRYASVFEWQSEYADFGIDELKHLIDECEKYNVDVEFMLSLISVESSYISTARSKTSSASGYCQIIRSTANWIYEDIMKKGDYDEENHETLAIDKYLSIDMGVAYVNWLSKRPYTNGDYTKIAMKYYGSTDETSNMKYAEKIQNRMIELFGIREYYEVFYPEGLSGIDEIN